MSLLLALLYPLAIQYERGGWWRVVLPVTALALVIDVLANYSELALLTWDWPQANEFTFSKRLARLRLLPGWRGWACWRVARWLDWCAPSGVHVA